MNLPVNNEPLTVKLTSEELNEFITYLIKCYNNNFILDYTTSSIEKIYTYHLIELINKTVQKRIKLYYKPFNTVVKLKINDIEQHLCSVLFKRYECSPFLLQLQPRFINKLIK